MSTKSKKPPKANKPAPVASPDAVPEPNATGVIGSIVEFLQAASESNPIKKADILAKLKERFPAREELALHRTLNCQLPTRLRTEKKLDIVKTDDGYYIKG